MPTNQTNDCNEKFDPFKAEFMIQGVSDFMPMASAMKGMYDAFLNVGFTERMACDLLKAWLTQLVANMKGGNK